MVQRNILLFYFVLLFYLSVRPSISMFLLLCVAVLSIDRFFCLFACLFLAARAGLEVCSTLKRTIGGDVEFKVKPLPCRACVKPFHVLQTLPSFIVKQSK